jgi:hypothetical protein
MNPVRKQPKGRGKSEPDIEGENRIRNRYCLVSDYPKSEPDNGSKYYLKLIDKTKDHSFYKKKSTLSRQRNRRKFPLFFTHRRFVPQN